MLMSMLPLVSRSTSKPKSSNLLYKKRRVLLHQGFAARNFNQPAPVGGYHVDDLSNLEIIAFLICIPGVTV